MKQLMLPLLLCLVCIQAASSEPVTVKEEVLGPWHYLYPLETYRENSADPQWSRYTHTPTAIIFGNGEHIATLLPGSLKIAEFADAQFNDLGFPSEFAPSSLSVDCNGALYCLAKKLKRYPQGGYDLKGGFLFSYDSVKHRWSSSVELPAPIGKESDFNRIQFDSHNRAWALGPSGKVAVLQHGKWDSYAYSSDKQLGFIPTRMTEGTDGGVTLFSNYQGQRETSRMKGTLLYKNGAFSAQTEADTTALCAAQKQMDEALPKDDFDRNTGYACHSTGARNVGYRFKTKTVLQTNGIILVSFGNDGLAWCRKADLETAPKMSEDTEWESVNNVIMPPTMDPTGSLWVAKDKPSRLISITAQDSREFPIPDDVKFKRNNMTFFDQLGRPWFLGFYGQSATILFDPKDQTFQPYASVEEAMRAHTSDYHPGAIFASRHETDRYGGDGIGIYKTKSGMICLGGPIFENFTILDGEKTLAFGPAEINPEQANTEGGHGYNPFSHGEASEDENGDITTCVDHVVFSFHEGKWIKKGGYQQPGDPGQFTPKDCVPNDHFATGFAAADGRTFFFKGFHFYEQTSQGAKQIDEGLNPLAFYPFWKGWYSSPGATQPRLDPTGRIWISSQGPYSQDQNWSILRKPVP